MKHSLVAVLLLMPLVALNAQTASKPCSTPEHRAFDFWVGEWRVETPDGKVAGHNSITVSYNGCTIEERWRGAKGMSGASFNIYDATTRKWHQTWVDNTGMLLLLDGAYSDGVMRLSGKRLDNDGKTVHDRITWSKVDGRVRQVWEQSSDGSKWTVVFDGRYVPVSAASGPKTPSSPSPQ